MGNVFAARKQQLFAFEATYYRADLEFTRLITEYKVLVNATTCVDAVTTNAMIRAPSCNSSWTNIRRGFRGLPRRSL